MGKVKKAFLFHLILFLIVSQTGYAYLLDDFEDGDYTANPAWQIVQALAGGDAAVVADPFDPQNQVIAGHNDPALLDHYIMETTQVDAVGLTGLELRSKVLLPDVDSNGGVRYQVGNDSTILGMTTAYLADDWYLSIVCNSFHSSVPLDHSYLGQWWNMRFWVDSENQLLIVEAHLNVDNTLVSHFELDYTFSQVPQQLRPSMPDLSGSTSKAELLFYGGGNWVYADNLEINYIPEPCTLSLLALGGLTLARKRKQ